MTSKKKMLLTRVIRNFFYNKSYEIEKILYIYIKKETTITLQKRNAKYFKNILSLYFKKKNNKI